MNAHENPFPRIARRLLPTVALAVLAAAPAASALPSSQTYKVGFRGDQTTSWTYTGTPLKGGGGCSGGRNIEFRPPSSGKGTHQVTFKVGKPVKTVAYSAGNDAGFYARFNVKASSSISGQYAERWSQVQDCDGKPVKEDVVADTSGCGDFTWKMTVDLKYNLNTQKGRFYARGQGIPLYNPASVFRWDQTCPFFHYPTGDFFQLEDDNGDSWDTHGQGILYRYAAVKGKKLLRPRGKTLIISRSASKSYSKKMAPPDDQDTLSGSTEMHWAASLKPVKR
jgi:hypothetical protein